MKGKIGLVVGIGIGYVLGTRAGRERYEQIKEAAGKVWNLPQVQTQVAKVEDLAKSAALALPRTLWNTGVKVAKAAAASGTTGEKLDRASATARAEAPTVKRAAAESIDEVVEAADEVAEKLKKPRTKKG